MINTIIFDLGGVLIDWNPTYLYANIFNDQSEMNYFLENICTPDWNEEQDAGRSLREATTMLVEQYPDKEEQIRAFYDRWEEMLGGVIQGTVDVLAELKRQEKYKLYALTNWSAETFPIAKNKYDFLGSFDGIVVSGTEKMRKPFPEFYNLLLSRYNVQPDRALFIDDNLRNIDAAKKIGMDAIHFSTPELLVDELRFRKMM